MQTVRAARLYVRVSTSEQAANGSSLATQISTLTAIAAAEGYAVAGVYIDAGVSASVPLADRPEGARMLAEAQRGDTIMAAKLDRVFRDTCDATGSLKTLKAAGVGLYLKDLGGDVAESSVSALIFGLLSSVAEFERSRIRERITDVARANKAAGDRFVSGSTPFGYAKVRDMHGLKKHGLVPIAAVHDEARKLKAQGYSARAAAGHLTGLGHRCTHKAVITLWQSMQIA